MSPERHIVLDGVPGKITSYTRTVVLPRRGVRPGGRIPPIHVTRRGFRIDRAHLVRFQKFCGVEPVDRIPFFYPLSVLFHYHLAIFAHPDFPWSLRKLLGLRNHVVQRRRLVPEDELDIDIRTIGQRVAPKGLEFDIHSTISRAGEPVWESVHVYYLRGDFGGEAAAAMAPFLPPVETGAFEVRWNAPSGGGWQFARLSGDFNPVHFFAPWARLLGFRRDFCHTPRIVSDCIQRLPGRAGLQAADAVRLDVAFKGPVYYGSPLVMRGAEDSEGYRFDLYCGDLARPAIPGRLRPVEPGHDLFAKEASTMSTNPVGWFEIYVQDMARAKAFYETVFGIQLTKLDSPGMDMLVFPMQQERYGAPGALVRMPGVPSGGNSVLVYFTCADCAVEAGRAAKAGGRIEKPKFSIGQHGFISLVVDTEGNMIGLHSMQ